MEFCGIHNHTEYSNIKLRDCIVKLPDLINRAICYGYKGIAITDHEVISGHVQALELQDTLRKNHPDFKIILGNEIYLIDKQDYQATNKFYHFLLIAKDEIGYYQLRQLSSKAWERSYTDKGMMRTPTFYQDFETIIGNDKGHLIASTACLGGVLASAILADNSHIINEFVPWMIKTFGKENCFLEMQDSDSEEQKKVNFAIKRISDYFQIPYIITSDVHYLDKEDIDIHDAFLNSKEEKERETKSFYKYTYLKSIEEIETILSYLPKEVVDKGINNTMLIYQAVQSFDFRHSTIVPSRKPSKFRLNHLFSEWYNIYPAIKNFAYSDYEQDRYLLYLIEEGIKKKGIALTEEILNRIDTELDVVWYISERLGQRLSAYLNLVKNIIDIIWRVSFVGVSRGSAGCFLINYLIDIVQMNPLKYNIPYWRFANKERVDMMDIDIDVNPEKVPQIISLLREYYGQDNVLNCLTFKTESTKSAILTAARGLGINNDEAQLLSSMVPVERGKVSSLRDCLEGNKEKELLPVPGFKEAFNKYDNLLETVQKIEGLISGRGIHASALYIFNNGYIQQNSAMRAPNKTLITAFNMLDSDSLGALKFDLLSTELQTKFMKAFELLLKDGVIQWQGSLRATYNKYLHPDVLDYDNPIMWDKVINGEIINTFQFEGVQGQICIKKTKPRTVSEMGAANAVMRLGATPDFMPIDRYTRFKNNIQEWYIEMEKAGLESSEMQILEKHLLGKYGCSIEQEDLMQILMDPHISNFSLKEANNARKIVAKKKVNQIQELKKQYYEKGAEIQSRVKFLDYVWKTCVVPQLGYSFSSPHDIAYSIEAVQQMNIATRFNSLYWNCACLSVNSGSSATDFEDFGDEEEGETVEEDWDDDIKNNNTNYGKVAKAIGEIMSQNIKVLLPDINKAEIDFLPDIEQNAIIYGLQAINGINSEIAKTIIQNRPYKSLENFIQMNDLTTIQMINLIKAGCFDKLEQKHRLYIMENYLSCLASQKISKKDNLTMANYSKAIELNVIPSNFALINKMICFKKWIEAHCSNRDLNNKITYTLQEEDEIKFFRNIVMNGLLIDKDYYIVPKGYIVKSSSFKRFYEKYINPLKIWLATPEAKDLFYEKEKEEFINKLQQKYCIGNISKWEMDSLNFYYHNHELANIDNARYNICNFNLLPETPKILRYKVNSHTGIEYPIYQLNRIAGTVLNTDKTKHIVTLLTVFGVVDVKFYKFSFIQYNKRISKIVDGKKQIIEPSWFTRGNKLLITGVRKENMFIPRKDIDQKIYGTVQLITEVNKDSLILKSQRAKGDE